METITFDITEKLSYSSKCDGKIVLSKKTWEEHILKKHLPIQFNSDKIGPTLLEPDIIRQSSRSASRYLYYKEFPTCFLRSGETIKTHRKFKYFTIVVDSDKKSIKTIYQTGKIKKGKVIYEK